MAIAPFGALLPRFRQYQRRRIYSRQVIEQWLQSLPGRVLPALAHVPLPLFQPDQPSTPAAGTSLIDVLAHTERLLLLGQTGSGRSLALRQVLLAWANDDSRLATTVPLYLPVPLLGDDPDRALQRCVAEAGFEAEPLMVERGLASGCWVLLIDGWDVADVATQQCWRDWLLDLTARYPALSAVVVAAPHTPAWPDFDRWELRSPTPDLLEYWVRVLLPTEEPALVLPPLLYDDRLQHIAEHFSDVALLALIYERNGFPPNRGRLYATALDHVLRPVAGVDLARVRMALAALGYEIAVTQRPQPVPLNLMHVLPALDGVFVLDDDGRACLTSSLWSAWCVATHVASTQLWEVIDPDAPLWQEALPLLAGMVADSNALYTVVCGIDRPTPQRTLLLGRCLREHRVVVPGWTTAIVGALAKLAAADHAQAGEARHLLATMPDVLATTIAEQLTKGPAGEHWVLGFLRLLPAATSVNYLLDVIGDGRLTPSSRRAAALHAQTIAEPLLLEPLTRWAEKQLDDLGRLLVTLLLATSGPVGRQYSAELVRAGRTLFPPPAAPADSRDIVRAATALLADQTLNAATHTVATLALRGCASDATAPLLLQACTSASPPLRQAARRTLLEGDSSLALRSLGRLVLGDDIHWAARHEALHALISLNSVGVVGLLLRVLQSDMPLAGRIDAAHALVQRNGVASARLTSLLTTATVSPALRAALIQLLAQQSDPAISGRLLTLGCDDAVAPVRAYAIRALQGHHSADSLAVIAGIVERERDDLEALTAAIETLGACGDESGVWALRTILLGPLPQQLATRWEAVLPAAMRHDPPQHWNTALLPPTFCWRWGVALADGVTAADTPSSLYEIVARETQHLRTSAARALSSIGGPTARQVLHEALTLTTSFDSYAPAPAIAAELATLHGGPELMQTLGTSAVPEMRWVAAQALYHTADVLLTRPDVLEDINMDSHIHSAMLLAISDHAQTVPLLEAIIVDQQAALGLRCDAIAALGQHGAIHAEGLLLALITNPDTDPTLQIAALDALQAPLHSTTLGAVRQLLREPRPLPELGAAALRCLARVGDTESLALFLRYVQHDLTVVALPAIDGLAMTGDPAAAPLLQRLAHASTRDTRIRLHAVGALIRLEGPQHLGLLHQLLETGSLSTRLVALDMLLAVSEHPHTLLPTMQATWPMPLRLRLAQALMADAHPESLTWFGEVLEDDHESLVLRCLAVDAVCAAQHAPILPLLEYLARDDATPLPLRRRAIAGLRNWRTTPTTMLTLSALAETDAPYLRSWAIQSLLA